MRKYLPVGVVESHGVDDVGVLVEREQLLAGVRVPHFAGAVVAARDELVARLVECTVGQREQVRAQHFEQAEALLLVLLLLLNKFFDQLLQLGLARLRDQRLFEQNLVNEAVDIRPGHSIN